ncbi:MAG: 30S ribosomal protein S6 [Anaerolineae bacterium]
MRDYEFMFIVHPDVDEAGISGVVDTVSGLVTGGSGQVLDVKVWGRRRLAHPIKKQHDGTYVMMNTQLQPKAIPELEHELKLNENILRYILVRAEA